ncbi:MULTISPECIES: chaplin family protein [unclassified Streptomyces]|uniref:chaplin family protein n=1 Tax=unclassified Streptomyces TaxID=2593676 RepID=UPI0033F0A400
MAELRRCHGMYRSNAFTALTLSVAAVGGGFATATPASAGGIGDFLSPAFGTSCANKYGAQAQGATTHGTGAANGNLAGLPIAGPFNQCGGADLDPCAAIKPVTGSADQAVNQGGLVGVNTLNDNDILNILPNENAAAMCH